MRIRKSREISIFTVSFLDVFANTIGGLSFLLLLAIMMVGSVVFKKPKILTETLPDGYHNRHYVQWLSAREGLGNFLWSISSGQPPKGLQLDPKTGELSGVLKLDPTDGNEKQYKFQVNCESHSDEAQGDSKVVSQEFRLTVHREQPVNATPLRIVTETTLPAAYRGQPYPLSFAAEGGQPPYTWAWSGDLPAGLTLGPGGQISGTPAEVGKSTFTVKVTPSKGEPLSDNFSLNISDNYPPPPPVPPLKVLTTKLPSAIAKREYTVQLAAEGGSPPYRWQLVGGELPPGLTLDKNTGAVSGSPERAGDWDCKLTLADAEGQTAAPLPIKLEVLTETGARQLVIITRSIPTLLTSQSSEIALGAEGGALPYQWRSSSSLPAGLALENGRIAGRPTTSGNYLLDLQVVDDRGDVASVTLPLNIRRVTPFWLTLAIGCLATVMLAMAVFLGLGYSRRKIQPLRITTESIPNARASFDYSLQLACTGGLPPYHWSVVAGELPPSLNLSEDGELAGCPFEGIGVDTTKEVLFTVQVKDHRGTTATQQL
ncbi:MAG TPA: Ig domain-containing protein [Pyrinomonadaceae bacterium]|nr:Ig domain-containing protein [Pyrinomonadaceae bacterium]